MRPPFLMAVGAATWLAACDGATPTSVAIPPEPSNVVLFGWQRSNLAFVPTAINDSGVIVGNQGTRAVRFFNGTVTVLPAPAVGFTQTYSAVDIARNGHILGVNGGSMLIWTDPTSLPQVVTFSTALLPSAILDDHTVVGTTAGRGFRWTPAGGVQLLGTPPTYSVTKATHVSRSGFIAGWAIPAVSGPPEGLVRWDANGTPTVLLPVGHSSPPENRPSDIDDFGNILSTSGGITVNWTVGGTVITIANVPTPTRTTAWSPLGRIVGHTIGSSNRPWTLYNGVLTWLPQPTPADQADIPVGVTACGTIVARRVNGGVVLDSGYVWRRSFTCDNSGVIQPSARAEREARDGRNMAP
jgi:hypothetical protein